MVVIMPSCEAQSPPGNILSRANCNKSSRKFYLGISMNRILRIPVAILCVIVTLNAAAAESASRTNLFPIMPWNTPPSDPAVLKKIHDCGFTLAGFVPPSGLDACAAAGLEAIVTDPRASDYDWAAVDERKARMNISNLVAQVSNHRAVFGYDLRDEPPATWFPGLEKVASAVRDIAPGKWPYINLFPDYANDSQLATTNYEEYLERFIATCHPEIISYDNYALMDDGSLRVNYWTNLEAVRNACKKHRIEFWNIVLAVAHFNYREPTPADLRFEAYTTLAYGGRGLAYFTYFAPAVGNYRGAAIDQFGNETPTWHNLQNINLQIQKLGATLLQLATDDVYHIGDVPADCKGPPADSLVTAIPGGTFLVGEFTHRDGSRYVLIVNKDLAKSHPCSPRFRKPPHVLRQVSPYSGSLLPFEGEYVWLAPGQGVLLKLD